jgi:hypothetical protein
VQPRPPAPVDDHAPCSGAARRVSGALDQRISRCCRLPPPPHPAPQRPPSRHRPSRTRPRVARQHQYHAGVRVLQHQALVVAAAHPGRGRREEAGVGGRGEEQRAVPAALPVGGAAGECRHDGAVPAPARSAAARQVRHVSGSWAARWAPYTTKHKGREPGGAHLTPAGCPPAWAGAAAAPGGKRGAAAPRGMIPTTQVQGCRRRLRPTWPRPDSPERSSRAGVCSAPPLATTTGAQNATRRGAPALPHRASTPTARLARGCASSSSAAAAVSKMMDSAQAPVTRRAPPRQASASQVLTVSCFCPRAHPKQLHRQGGRAQFSVGVAAQRADKNVQRHAHA